MSQSSSINLLDLPSEVLQNILFSCSTPSFIQATLTCHKLFDLARKSREVILEHLQEVPGIKLGLEDHSISTSYLFLTLRQRASAHLYGVNFTADCRDYRFPNGTLDSSASCLASSTDYINISLVLKESNALRLYSGRCHCKEHIDSPYADGIGKIIQVVHRKHTISVLYEYTPNDYDKPDVFSMAELPVFKSSTKQILAESIPDEGGCSSSQRKQKRYSESNLQANTKYHLIHYSAYNTDRPVFSIPIPFNITRTLVPVHLAIANRLQCAIIWDIPKAKLRPSIYTRVLLYSCGRIPEYTEGSYTVRQVYPSLDHSNESDNNMYRLLPFLERKPRAAEFYKDGRRLKLYHPSSVVPYAVINTSNLYTENSGSPYSVNEFCLNGNLYKIDTAFYCAHETLYEQDRVDCAVTHLCLGTTTALVPNGGRVLCILQNRHKMDYDDCRHTVELDSMPHMASNSRVVARLCGWKEYSSTLTGLETVCISKKGTRIAIAMWDRVLVWCIEPSVFCDDMGVEEFVAPNGTRITSLQGTKFYDMDFDLELADLVVMLKPIVLKLGGCVARKMMWTSKEADEIDREVAEEFKMSGSDSSESEHISEKDGESEEEVVEGLNQGQQDQNLPRRDDFSAPDIEDNDPGSQSIATDVLTPDMDIGYGDDETSTSQSNSKAPVTNSKTDARLEKTRVNLINNLPLHPPPPAPFPPSPPASDLIETKPSSAQISASEPPIPIPAPDPPPLEATNETTTENPRSNPPSSNSHSISNSSTASRSRSQSRSRKIGSKSKSKRKSTRSSSSTTSDRDRRSSRRGRHRVRVVRNTEDELVILTDRGVQRWDLGAWGRGRRIMERLDERLS